MDKEELELKEQLKLKKKEFLKKRKMDQPENKSHHQNTSVYISNLSKESIKVEDIVDLFSRYGKIREDEKGNYKIKLYKDENGVLKGDALVNFMRPESARLAIEMMDGYLLVGNKIKVEEAKFVSNKKQKIDVNVDDNTVEARKRNQKSVAHSHNEMDEGRRKERTLILANIIDIYADLEPDEIKDIKEDLTEGCAPFGDIIQINIDVDKGYAEITFDSKESALKCRDRMNGRFFDGRKLLAYTQDEEDIQQPENSPKSDAESIYSEDSLIEETK